MRTSRRLFWTVLVLLSLASFFNYFDRQTVSVLKTTLKAEFGMDDRAYALLLNVFTGAYAIAYIASGWVVDKLGPRVSLTIFMSAWSLVTIACGFAKSFGQLATLRAVLGLSEPGLFPVMIRAAAVWTEDKGRGVFMSLASAGSSVATVTAVPIVVWLSLHFHWRVSFVIPGVLGLVAALVWWKVYREPDSVLGRKMEKEPEKVAAEPLSWGRLWTRRELWGILLCRLISDPVWYFSVFWMPGYLQEQKGLDTASLGFVGWIPFLAGNVGGLAFAALSDRTARNHGVRGRSRLVMAVSLLGPLSLIIPQTQSIAVTLAVFCVMGVVCSAWLGSLAPIIAEVFPLKNVASVWGISGAFGAAGAMLFNYAIGQVTATLGTDRLFLVMAVLHPCAAVVMAIFIRAPRSARQPQVLATA